MEKVEIKQIKEDDMFNLIECNAKRKNYHQNDENFQCKNKARFIVNDIYLCKQHAKEFVFNIVLDDN